MRKREELWGQYSDCDTNLRSGVFFFFERREMEEGKKNARKAF